MRVCIYKYIYTYTTHTVTARHIHFVSVGIRDSLPCVQTRTHTHIHTPCTLSHTHIWSLQWAINTWHGPHWSSVHYGFRNVNISSVYSQIPQC